MTGRLLHYSSAPLGEILTVGQADNDHPYGKPQGLWVSVEGDDDWATWCSSELPEWLVAKQAYVVDLAKDANILRLKDAGDIDSFHNMFAERSRYYGESVAWQKVAARYDGIIIAPYVWSRRLHPVTAWYYGWDCASGCIWNARAIAGVSLLQEAA